MGKVIKTKSVDTIIERSLHGRSLIYVDIGLIELWLFWFVNRFINREQVSWKKVYTAAKCGKLCVKSYTGGMFSDPVYTTIFQLRRKKQNDVIL